MIPAATTVWCPFPMQPRSLLDLPTAGFLPRFRRCGPTCQALMVRILSREASANSCAKVMTVACWFSTLVPRLSQRMSVSELLPCIRAQVLHRSIHRSSSLSPTYGEVSSVFSPTSGVTLDFLEGHQCVANPQRFLWVMAPGPQLDCRCLSDLALSSKLTGRKTNQPPPLTVFLLFLASDLQLWQGIQGIQNISDQMVRTKDSCATSCVVFRSGTW